VIYLTKISAIPSYPVEQREFRKGHPVVSIATSKSGVIDRMRVTAVTAITPCVGGLVIWYPDHDDIRTRRPSGRIATIREPGGDKSGANRHAFLFELGRARQPLHFVLTAVRRSGQFHYLRRPQK
jgi:hypothetical protein